MQVFGVDSKNLSILQVFGVGSKNLRAMTRAVRLVRSPPIRRKPYIQEGVLVLDFARSLLGKRDCIYVAMAVAGIGLVAP